MPDAPILVHTVKRCLAALAAGWTLSLTLAGGAVAAPPELTATAFNIAHARLSPNGLADIARVIRSSRPDVVALQEVDRSWSRSQGVDQATELGRLLGMHADFDPNLDCAARDLEGDGFCQYGTAILSR